MDTCFRILPPKFTQKLSNRCIGLTLHVSSSTVFEVLAQGRVDGSWLKYLNSCRNGRRKSWAIWVWSR